MQEAMCQVCFEVRKCRTKYMGLDGLLVCIKTACLAVNGDRKREAKQLAGAKLQTYMLFVRVCMDACS